MPRKAYDQAARFLRDTSLSFEEIEQLNSEIAGLRSAHDTPHCTKGIMWLQTIC